MSLSVISFPFEWNLRFFSSWRMLYRINCHRKAGINVPFHYMVNQKLQEKDYMLNGELTKSDACHIKPEQKDSLYSMLPNDRNCRISNVNIIIKQFCSLACSNFMSATENWQWTCTGTVYVTSIHCSFIGMLYLHECNWKLTINLYRHSLWSFIHLQINCKIKSNIITLLQDPYVAEI